MSCDDYSFTKEMALIEAILYLEGEPIALQAISEASGLSNEIVESALEKLQEEYRATLKAFYSVIKSLNGGIHLSFLTGVTKFSKVSIFSDLNNLYGMIQ